MDAEIGQRLRRARVDAGFSQQQVADFTSMSKVTVGKSERGDRKVLASEIRELAIVLNTSPDVLLGHIPRYVKGKGELIEIMSEELTRARDEVDRLRLELEQTRTGICLVQHWRRSGTACELKLGHVGQHKSGALIWAG
jgi:transcriptional regulator with XRE-family HTH domain